MGTFKQTFESKLIYVFRINDENHKDVLKVGEASVNSNEKDFLNLEPNCKLLNNSAKNRINEYTTTAGIKYELLYTEVACFIKDGKIISFTDHKVHNVLVRSGIKHKYFNTDRKASEWFYTDLETVKNAIKAVKEGRKSLTPDEISTDKSPIDLRPEQRKAVDMAVKIFKKKTGSHRMLWNAKMRFGKTISALQVIKECDYKRTLILTHRPVVDEGWFEDFQKIFYDKSDYIYVSKNKGEDLSNIENFALDASVHYICFASIQDMRGSEIVGGKFDKNELLFSINWDLVIIDEAHEGTQTELGKRVLDRCKKEDTRVLHLSGTPFNLMDDFNEDEIFTWDYIMEQRAKADWDTIHQGDHNPYACLPRLNIYTYNLGKLFADYADADIAFNFKEFFKVDKEGNFIHELNIKQFLDLLVKEDKESNYPFSTQEYRDNFRHSLWMVPGVKEARALSELLRKHPVFSQFKIANVAGDGDEEVETKDALKLVEDAIGLEPENSYSITLSCGRLTTGVSVKPWTACLMLSGSYNTAASAYMQTIFRVQTPATIGGKQKTECFVFDFAPDRTLKVIAETAKISSKAGKTTGNDRKILGDFINFCPIICFEGSETVKYDTDKMLEQLKKVYVEKVVKNGFEDNYLYNSDLMKLDSIELEEFTKLKKIIGTTKSMAGTGDINMNALGLDNEEYEELGKKKPQQEKRPLTPEEEKRLKRIAEAKKNRDSAISILRGISIRMPLMIYGADLNKELDGEEEEITIDNFADKIDDQSWLEFMPSGVTKELFNKFKKYYDKDIFRAAGKKIRQMAKSADNFSIEERISRIATIFNSFRNPDKETVLTPWRVVNMHMTDCLGGYRFYDKDYKEIREEPEFVEQADVTKNVYKKNTHILEINSKSGLYALYCAYSVYKARAKLELGPKPTREMEKDLWRKVLKDNIFVICKTPMAKSITKRTLAGFTQYQTNSYCFDDLNNQLLNKSNHFIEKILKPNTWNIKGNEKMNFDAIVGNPPYTENIGTQKDNYGINLYNHFIENAITIAPNFVSMITPSKWFSGGRKLDDFRKKMLSDKRLKKIVDFTDSKDCFPTADIPGGVNYFLWDKSYEGDCLFTNKTNGNESTLLRKLDEYDIFIRYNEALTLINKMKKNCTISLGSILSSQTPFGFITTYRGHEEYFENAIKLKSSGKDTYVSFSDIKRNIELIDKYKVFISKATCEHAGIPDKNGKFRVISSNGILSPKEVCTQSYLILGDFDNNIEPTNCLKYLKTKFLRALVLITLTSQDISSDKFMFVPMQDFTENSDINWSKSITKIDESAKAKYGLDINEIDAQLYTKYGLDKSEIEFIEKMIKPME